ncbi:hypothetical protein ACFU5O_27895 [Streptomyces sp. NPDC057445]|uniref:hypothetical protein n=1 Tax=Streptomyces sp. NPDC057445 TaxID=3346136 RepID=UPI0036C0923B
MNSNDSNHAPLRDVAQSPEATARYLADIQRVLLDIGKNLETLQLETRVHCRHTRVEGDHWYSARLRALPVDRQLAGALKDLRALSDGLEKSAHKRHAHDEGVREVARKRQEKALEKQRKKAAALQSAPEPKEDITADQRRYSGPKSLYDLTDRETA